LCYAEEVIIGIDEVGRGAWAGPLVVGAVLLGNEHQLEGLTDSKLLTKKRREILDREIRVHAKAIGLGWVSAKQIDMIGLGAALKVAAARAMGYIRGEFKEIIIDGTIRLVEDERVITMKKADLLIPSVSAASIVAKVARDKYMAQIDNVFRGYGFAGHVGYGTAGHRQAIEQHGASLVHRMSFAPLAPYRTTPVATTELETAKVTTRQLGNAGESIAVEHLESLGHTVVARNWRTKYCEIDVISSKGSELFFTEVKYRKSRSHGSGLEAITAKKRAQMTFAAQLYMTKYPSMWNPRLAVAEVTGRPPQLQAFIELT
jgi:ribonuclease HII